MSAGGRLHGQRHQILFFEVMHVLLGDIDLALMTPQIAPPSLRTRHLFDERYVLIGRHPRSSSSSNSWKL